MIWCWFITYVLATTQHNITHSHWPSRLNAHQCKRMFNILFCYYLLLNSVISIHCLLLVLWPCPWSRQMMMLWLLCKVRTAHPRPQRGCGARCLCSDDGDDGGHWTSTIVSPLSNIGQWSLPRHQPHPDSDANTETRRAATLPYKDLKHKLGNRERARLLH